MTVYEYRCRGCGVVRESELRDDNQPCSCGELSRRVYGFRQAAGLQPHFNHAVGRYVTNNRDFNDALKERSEVQSLRTGIDSNYVRVDPGDMAEPTKDTEIFETRDRMIRDNNIDVSKLV